MRDEMDAPAPTLKSKSAAQDRRPAEKQGLLISRQSLHYQVADKMREMIVHGDLAAGEKVPVGALSAQLGVSPTPLREALKILGEEGLVELLPNRGARVAPFTSEQATALFEVIAGLEGLAAELATKRMGEADLAELEELHARMRDAFAARKRQHYFELNNRIHDAIVALSRNDVLIPTHQRLLVRARRGRYIAIVDPGRWEEAMAEHEAVMDAFRRRNAAKAAKVWRQHLERSGAVLARMLETQEAEASKEG